jgi:hypothetical protein
MQLETLGCQLGTQFLFSAACNELVPPCTLDKNVSHKQTPQSMNAKHATKVPLPFMVPQGRLLTCKVHRKVNLSSHSILLYTIVNPTPE